MKSISLVLRIVAILGAVAAVALWFNTRGIIKQATEDMQSVPGATLLEKSANVPQIVETQTATSRDLSASQAKVADLTARNTQLSSDFEAERSRTVKLNNDLAKLQNESRRARVDLEEARKAIAENETLIENLKTEIVTARQITNTGQGTDELRQRISQLESQLTALQQAYQVASEKARILDLGEIVEVVEIDQEAGTKTVRKIIKVPYVRTGDIATVTRVEGCDDMAAINRGRNDGVSLEQKIDLKNDEGRLIANVRVIEVGDDFAVVSINPKVGLPERLESGDMLELVPTVELPPEALTVPAATGAEAAPAPEVEEDDIVIIE